MQYIVEPGIFERFPGFRRGVIIGRNVRNAGAAPELEELLNKAQATVYAADISIMESPRIVAWRNAYLNLGFSPKDFPPSIDFLIRHIKKGRRLRSINKLVDIFNTVSLNWLMPCGGDDLDCVKGPLTLGFADGSELYHPLGSPGVERKPSSGEVIYFDAGKKIVMCRCWNWKNSDLTKITPATRNVVINVDAFLPNINLSDLDATTSSMADLVLTFCGGEIHKYLLEPDNPSFEF